MESIKGELRLGKIRSIKNNIVTLNLDDTYDNVQPVANDITELILRNRARYQRKHNRRLTAKAKDIYRYIGIGLICVTCWLVSIEIIMKLIKIYM